MRCLRLLPIAVVLMMIFGLFSIPAFASQVDPNAKLAEWKGGYITVNDYKSWWQRIDPKERPQLKTLDEKTEFLEKMIDARLLLAGAESLGIDTLPNIRNWLEKQRLNTLKKALEDEAISANIKIDPAEVEKLLARRTTTIIARHLVVPNLELAKAILDSIKAGVPFEDLAYRHSTDSSAPNGGYIGSVKWGDFSEKWCEHAFALQPGQVSEPIMVESGYVIIKVEGRKEEKLDNPEQERRRIEYMLYKDRFVEQAQAFRDSLFSAYRVEFDDRAIVRLASRYAQAMQEMGISSTVVDVDVVPDLTTAERETDVVRFEGGSFTMGEVVDMILSFPYPTRPRYDDPEDLFDFLARQLTDTLYVREAIKRGLDSRPQVKAAIDKARQQRLTTAFFRQLTMDVTVPEDTLRLYYEKNREEFRVKPGYIASKIVVGTKESADSVLTRLRAGDAFEDIARRRSRDPFTAPNGGDMGFSPLGKDEEFDSFVASMKEGDIGVFRSIEGWVVLWLREKRQDRLPDFEEVRDRVERKFLPRYKDQALNQWLSKRRKEIGLRINSDLLSRITVEAFD